MSNSQNFKLPEGLRELTFAEVRNLNTGDKIHAYVVMSNQPESSQVVEIEVQDVDHGDENRAILFHFNNKKALDLFGDKNSETLGGPLVRSYGGDISGWTCTLGHYNATTRSDAFIPAEVLEGYGANPDSAKSTKAKDPETFEVGDLVFFPRVGNEIYVLEPSGSDSYPLECADFSLTKSGRILKEDYVQSIWHATEANCKKLEAMYEIEFEKIENRKLQALQMHHKNGAIFLLTQGSMKPESIFNLQGAEMVEIKEISDKAVLYADGYAQPITEGFLENLHAVELTKTGKVVYL